MDIKPLRMAAGISQDELARKSLVSRVSIARYESGKREPKLSIAVKLADALGCSVDELIGKKKRTKKERRT